MKGLRRLLDKSSAYLPVLIMALLALASWWLVKSVPVAHKPETRKAVRQGPDYRLTDFSIMTFTADGRMTRQVFGGHAQHFPGTQSLQIDDLRLALENESGRKLKAQAAQGFVTDDGQQLTLHGQALTLQPSPQTRPPIERHGEQALPGRVRITMSSKASSAP